MRVLSLGLSWTQFLNQVLGTVEDVDFCMVANGDSKRVTGEKRDPPGTNGGQQSRRNCKSRVQRALENPGTINPTGGRVKGHKRKK